MPSMPGYAHRGPRKKRASDEEVALHGTPRQQEDAESEHQRKMRRNYHDNAKPKAEAEGRGAVEPAQDVVGKPAARSRGAGETGDPPKSRNTKNRRRKRGHRDMERYGGEQG